MCGINGAFAYRSSAPPVSEQELVRTRDHMAARGPDGVGLWVEPEGRCGLGHRRLAIIDLSDRALQPMLAPEDDLAIVFNGEIYNFPELRVELEAQGRIFRTDSDTEALLHLYRLRGPAMVERLRGMFALAIWDGRRRGLFLARDPYGIKPLYYADDGATVRFASQVKALLAGGGPATEFDPAGVTGFYLWGSAPEPFTLYRGIRALPAGCTLWVDDDSCAAPRSYSRVPGVIAAARTEHPVDPDRLIGAAVADSVKAHLLADVEVGVFLSAGVDSGALLGLMRDAGQARVRAITLAFEEFAGSAEDEVPLASVVARQYGAEHIVRRVSAAEFQADMPLILAAMDQPSIDGVNTWFVAKAAKEAGLKVALSGVGGDELLAGYESFSQVPRLVRQLGPAARSLGVGRLARSLILAAGVGRRTPKLAGVLEYAGDFAAAYFLRRALYLPFELNALLDPELLREGLEALDLLPRLRRLALEPDPGSDVGRVAALESTQYLRNQLLRDTDWAGMAHSLEIRTPLVDIKLLQDVAPIMGGLTARRGKLALAHAPSLPLPDSVTGRDKTGFGVPTGHWRALGASITKGQASRRWAREVLDAALSEGGQNTSARVAA